MSSSGPRRLPPRPLNEEADRVLAGDGRTVIVLVADGGRETVLWRASRPGPPDLEVVDALARLQLAARRARRAIRLVDPCPELGELVELLGLTDLLRDPDGLVVQVVREATGREELGHQEVVPPGDPGA